MTSARTNNSSEARNDAFPLVAFDAITKSFFGIPVLKGVSFELGAGKILGLVGENGAGKSTLMNLLGGNLQPDAGSLQINGRPYAPRDPHDARTAGIAFVHQELNLFPNLSIAENLHLTSFPLIGWQTASTRQCAARPSLPWIARARLRRRTAELLDQVGLSHSPQTPVERLSIGERQLIEIAKALGDEALVLIFDEPTTSLSAHECERLFLLMQRLRQRGLGIIYISHALDDVLRLCDELVVLRDGEVVGRGPVKDFSYERMVWLMVGRRLGQLYPAREKWKDRTQTATGIVGRQSGALQSVDARIDKECGPLLSVDSLSQPGIVRGVSFRLDHGEVLGLFGLMGAGRSELARILFGLDPCAHGEIRLEGLPLGGGPRRRMRRGLAFLTEDRHQEGLCLNASISDNLVLVTLPALARTVARLIDFARLRDGVARVRAAIGLSPHAAGSQAVKTLSGGNQQRVVLGKWLLAAPKVFLLDEPTRGIDVGARFEIYELIVRLADGGAGVLLISSEIEELLGMCDRILVMSHGEITGEFPRENFDRERILGAALQESATAASRPLWRVDGNRHGP